MTNELVLHASTSRDVKQFLESPSHCLLLMGPEGSGKPSLAKMIISQLLGGDFENHPYILHLKPEKQTLSIQQVRSAQDFVKLKTTGTGSLRRAIIVEDAHTLSHEAQNAFLKLLEEPPSDTIIILTSSSSQSLLPTIKSRTQKISLRTPLKSDLEVYFKESADNVQAAYYMSNGQPGLMTRILENTNDDLLGYIDQAKQLLRMTSFERLVFVDQFIKQKRSSAELLWSLAAICNAALHSAVKKSDVKTIKHWQSLLSVTNDFQQQINVNPNQKLQLTALVLSF